VAAEDIETLAKDVRSAGALGRSPSLNRLFDYLAQVSAEGARPKEFEVAAAVFGRDAGFDGAQDASVRVAVHRLRRKLEDFYSGPGRAEPVRLTVPRGEYRLEAILSPSPSLDAVTAPTVPGWPSLVAAIAVLALTLVGGWALGRRDGYEGVRRQAPWAQLAGGGRPLLVVVGDYYIFGDMDQAAGPGRLVREYGVNSPADLDNWLMDHPEMMGRYRDLDLYYLPVGVGAALRDVMPVLAPKARGRDQVRTIPASQLTAEMLRRNDILYVGYLSGLRTLRDPVFAGSRFRLGETYDELIDTRTGNRFESQEGGPLDVQGAQRDLGYMAAFRGPDGNRIVILAGTRDMGLAEVAEAATHVDALKTVARDAKGADAFEALFEADGMRRANFGGRLVLASPLDAARIWAPAREPIKFPAG
jgi:hypothetical protein